MIHSPTKHKAASGGRASSKRRPSTAHPPSRGLITTSRSQLTQRQLGIAHCKPKAAGSNSSKPVGWVLASSPVVSPIRVGGRPVRGAEQNSRRLPPGIAQEMAFDQKVVFAHPPVPPVIDQHLAREGCCPLPFQSMAQPREVRARARNKFSYITIPVG